MNTNILVIDNVTAVRASVIFQRTENAFLAGAKSIMIENLKEKMRNGIAEFLFLKKDGTLRHAFGTTKGSLADKHINGNGISRENFATTAYFDVEVGAWRSFRWETLVKVF